MDKIALARLEMLNQIKLTDAQKDDVLSFFAKREADLALLDAVDTSKTEPMVHVMPTTIALREDEIEQIYDCKDLLSQAPDTDAGYFCVPRVME